LEFIKSNNFNRLKEYKTIESITSQLQSNNNNFFRTDIDYIILELAKFHKATLLNQTTLTDCIRDDIEQLISPEDIYECIFNY